MQFPIKQRWRSERQLQVWLPWSQRWVRVQNCSATYVSFRDPITPAEEASLKRWIEDYENHLKKLVSENPATLPTPVHPEYQTTPARLLQFYRNLLKQQGYDLLRCDQRVGQLEDCVNDSLRRFIQKEIPWLEYEDTVVRWYLYCADRLKAAHV